MIKITHTHFIIHVSLYFKATYGIDKASEGYAAHIMNITHSVAPDDNFFVGNSDWYHGNALWTTQMWISTQGLLCMLQNCSYPENTWVIVQS